MPKSRAAKAAEGFAMVLVTWWCIAVAAGTPFRALAKALQHVGYTHVARFVNFSAWTVKRRALQRRVAHRRRRRRRRVAAVQAWFLMYLESFQALLPASWADLALVSGSVLIF